MPYNFFIVYNGIYIGYQTNCLGVGMP